MSFNIRDNLIPGVRKILLWLDDPFIEEGYITSRYD